MAMTVYWVTPMRSARLAWVAAFAPADASVPLPHGAHQQGAALSMIT
jgi:hypothetical protein